MHRLLPLGAAATALALVAAVPASADSISFLRSGDVWVASPDGADGGPLLQPDLVAGRLADRIQHARRDILVGEVPSQAGCCTVPQQGAVTVIEGGELPDWDPADVAGPPAPGGPILSVERVALHTAPAARSCRSRPRAAR